jgi:UDPglucose 6-dehydrogenase
LNVTMLGSGYVGLVSGACFAEFGANVNCVDVDATKIERLQAGKIPIYEPCLDDLVKKNVEQGRLKFCSTYNDIIAGSDLIFIAVGTPSRHGDGHADLSYVFQAARDLAPHLKGYTVIVDKSTVPVGTARNVKRIISDENPDADFDIASNPEFLREGAAISDFMRPDRVVIGVESGRAEKLLRDLYRPLNLIESPILSTGLETAELIKYASNAFLATKISFINEMATLCEAVGADVHDISKGMGLDARIGRKFLHPGPGYGGSCFPKDTRALARIAQEYGAASRIVETVIEVNEAQKARMVKKIRLALGGDEAKKLVAVLGLTFKPETDDMREAPSLSILPKLIENGMKVRAHDPKGIEEAKDLLPESVEYINNLDEVFKDVDAIILLTEWNVYRGMDMKRVLESMSGNTLIDLRNVYEVDEMRALGFNYHCVGRA